MASPITLIIHGWSDCSDSFTGIKQYLTNNGVGDVRSIYYVDYESREDDITYDDVIDGLTDRLIGQNIINSDGTKKDKDAEINVIVHSTGGLVIRYWIWFNYIRTGKIADCPIKKIIMLAPANFGSPLAEMGKSFLGSLVKGRWKVGDLLEVGRKLLNGLEIASPFQWELANRDLLSNQSCYRPDQIQTTILVGNKDYDGIRGWVNKPGTDGTVVISGTTLNTVKLNLNYAGTDSDSAHRWTKSVTTADIAFGVIPGLDHGSIVKTADDAGASPVGPLILQALRVKDAREFAGFQKVVEGYTTQSYAQAGLKKYQQFIVHAIDDHNQPVNDFTLEFFILKASRAVDRIIKADKVFVDSQNDMLTLDKAEDEFSRKAHDLLTENFYTNSTDPSYRRFLVAISDIDDLLTQARAKMNTDVVLTISIHIPDIDNEITYETDNLQNIVIYNSSAKEAQTPSFFYENTTTMIELRVNRMCSDVWVDVNPRTH